MRVIYFHQYFNTPEMVGGTRSYEIAKRMVEAGHQVHMVTTRTEGAIQDEQWDIEEVDGITVHWLSVQYSNKMGALQRILAFTKFAREAGAYGSKLQGDVIFATSTPLTVAIPGVKVSRKLGVPLVFEVRDLWPEVPIAMGALRFPLSAWLARQLEKWAYRNSKWVIGLSPGMCDGIVKAGFPKDRVKCIPNGADVGLFQGAKISSQAFKDSREWLGNRPLVLYPGAVGRVNGLGYMVDLAKFALAINPEVRFLVVGDGGELSLIKSRAEDAGVLGVNFFIEPQVPKNEIPNIFNAATVCCSWVIDVKALWNNSANKVFDAFAAGKPVVINHGGWLRDLLERESAGLALPLDDLEGAAKQLIDFLEDSRCLAKSGQAALRLAREDFSRDKLASEVIQVLEMVVNDRA